LATFIAIIFWWLRPDPAPKPKRQKTGVFTTFTPRTLLPYNGHADGVPIYFAVNGRVFDVSAGKNFYGPGGPYANFAGRDASRGLATHSFSQDVITEDLDGPLDKLDDLSAEEKDALKSWEERFESKYQIVGKLISADEKNATALKR
jgi:membrane-associated progesterone receptor component